jgi:hypothetical protein
MMESNPTHKKIFIVYNKSRVGSGTRDFQKTNPQPDPTRAGMKKKKKKKKKKKPEPAIKP